MAQPICPAIIVSDGLTGAVMCQDELGAAVAWQIGEPFDVAQLDPTTLAAFFAAGFVIVGMNWFAGHCVKTVLDVVRRV